MNEFTGCGVMRPPLVDAVYEGCVPSGMSGTLSTSLHFSCVSLHPAARAVSKRQHTICNASCKCAAKNGSRKFPA
ncbi:hypothetical protein GN956_G22333 [Arapaima gigas]